MTHRERVILLVALFVALVALWVGTWWGVGAVPEAPPEAPETPSATVLEVDRSEVRVLCTEDGDRLYVSTGPGGGTDVEVVPEAFLADGC